jgi:hypothetical protein
MDLLAALRQTGEQILETERPQLGELSAVVGALVKHLEQHVSDLASVELDKLTGMKEPEAGAGPPATSAPAPAPAPAAPAAPAEPTPSPVAEPAPAGEEPSPIASEPAPPADAGGDDEAAEAATLADANARIAQLSQQLAIAQAQGGVTVDAPAEPAP